MNVPAYVMTNYASKMATVAGPPTQSASKQHSKRYMLYISAYHAIWRPSDYLMIVMRLRRDHSVKLDDFAKEKEKKEMDFRALTDGKALRAMTNNDIL